MMNRRGLFGAIFGAGLALTTRALPAAARPTGGSYSLSISGQPLYAEVTTIYPGLIRMPIDGNITRVAHVMHDDGRPFTEVTRRTRRLRNHEEQLIVPTYEQRQRMARLRGQLKLQRGRR